MFQLALRGGVEVRRVDLDEAVEQLGNEIGLEVGSLPGPAQDINKSREVCR